MLNPRNLVQRSIISGNSQLLWNAAKVSKNTNVSKIPLIMFQDGLQINQNKIPNAFAKIAKMTNEMITMFTMEITKWIVKIKIYVRNRYTSSSKITSHEKFKRTWSHSQRILIDRIEILKTSQLFLEKLMKQKNYPSNGWFQEFAQFKKGNSANIEH